MLLLTEEERLRLAALAYVMNLQSELTQENGAPPLGTQNRAVDFMLGDPELGGRRRDRRSDNRATPAAAERASTIACGAILNRSSDDEFSRPRTSPVGEREPVLTTPSSRQDRGVLYRWVETSECGISNSRIIPG
jgi:hypothetical protein